LEIFKIFSVSAAAQKFLKFPRLGGGSEIFKIFSVSAAAQKFLKFSPSRRRLSRSAYTSSRKLWNSQKKNKS
jgi:hypothetical protein